MSLNKIAKVVSENPKYLVFDSIFKFREKKLERLTICTVLRLFLSMVYRMTHFLLRNFFCTIALLTINHLQ